MKFIVPAHLAVLYRLCTAATSETLAVAVIGSKYRGKNIQLNIFCFNQANLCLISCSLAPASVPLVVKNKLLNILQLKKHRPQAGRFQEQEKTTH